MTDELPDLTVDAQHEPISKPAKRGRPRNGDKARAILQSPEVQAAIAAAVAVATAEATAAFAARILTERGLAGTAVQAGDGLMAEKLATAIANMTDESARFKPVRVSADEQAKRKAGLKLLQDLLIEATAKDIDLEYEIMAPQYLNGVFIEPIYVDRHTKRQMRERICWPNIPNEHMNPINAPAKEVFAAFMQWLGTPTEHNSAPVYLQHEAPKVEKGAGLKIHSKGGTDGIAENVPQVGRPGGGVRRASDRPIDGQVEEVRILGSTAAPAQHMP